MSAEPTPGSTTTGAGGAQCSTGAGGAQCSTGAGGAQGALDLPGLARAAARVRAPAAKPAVRPAAVDPIARVLVDLPLAHLDRPFDYLVPETMAQTARPGCRVKVRFAGQDVDGFVLERLPETDHPGKLQSLRRVVSPEPVLSAEIAELTDQVAQRWAGTRSDVLRLAVPPRHATTEKQGSRGNGRAEAPDTSGWHSYPGGTEILRRLANGERPRVVLTVLPGDDWAERFAEAVQASLAGGHGSLVCVPDGRDLDRLDAALVAAFGDADHHVGLRADDGPAKRYRAFLAISRGAVKVCIGTRAAAFAPVHDLGLVAMWDDGDDLFAEPRAPYSHAREVLLLRARQTGAAALMGAYSRSVEAQYLVRTGWASEVSAERDRVRAAVQPAVTGAADAELDRDPWARIARVPTQAYRALASALTSGPVLVQTPRAGYALRLACDRCRTAAECANCHGSLRTNGPTEPPSCQWCGAVVASWTCPECGGRGLRAPIVGDRRTAEEFGRAFPGVAIRTSSAGHVLSEVGPTPAVVVATPGAEPVAVGGYSGVLLLDTWLPLGRDDLRAEEEALRRWCNAAALVRPVAEGGQVIAVGEASQPALQALVRWDPAGFAERQIAERQSAHLPPASRLATLTASAQVLESLRLDLPGAAEVLGPVTIGEEERLVVRVPRAQGGALSQSLRALQQQRSARKLPHVRVQVDPIELT